MKEDEAGGLAAGIGMNRNTYKILVGKCGGKKSLGWCICVLEWI
jgi:hypothetical protein